MRSLTLILLAFTLAFSTMARSYQVARIHGQIIKISGDKIRVKDDKNQIFSVDRSKAYPIGSQIGDEVVIYQKVRFKSSYNKNTTSFFIKHRKTQMTKAIRKFMVSYESKMGFKYKKKKKYTFYDQLQNLFTIEEAHARLPMNEACHAGGRELKFTPGSDQDCEIAKEYECGEDNKGFRCSPAIFYRKDISKKDNYLNSILYIDEETKDKGFCVKHDGTNITRRCYNAALKVFGSESKADEFAQRKEVIDKLYANLDEDQDTIKDELEAMVIDIQGVCKDNDLAIESCDKFIQDIKDVENDLFGWAGAKKDQEKADEDEIRADEVHRMTTEVEKFMKEEVFGRTNQGQSQGQAQQFMLTPQGGSTQPVVYQLMLGNQMQGHNPMMAQMAQMRMQQPVVYILIPNYTPTPSNNNQGMSQDQLIQKLLDRLRGDHSDKPNKNEDKIDDKNVDDKEDKDKKTEINIDTYSYANEPENCKNYDADVCFVKQSDESFKNYKKTNGEYKEFKAANLSEDGSEMIEVDGENYVLESLTNTDPSLDWVCDVLPARDTEDNTCKASEVSCNIYDEDETLVAQNRRGYLSQDHAGNFGEAGGQFTYSFDKYTKVSTVSPPLLSMKESTEPGSFPIVGAGVSGEIAGKVQGIEIEGSEPQSFTQQRHPPLFYSPCEDYSEAMKNEKKQVRADNKSCIKEEYSYMAEVACDHDGKCDTEKITICPTDVSCQVEYKNAFNKLISDQTVRVTLDCQCERGKPDTVDIASCLEKSQERIGRKVRDDQPDPKSKAKKI